MVPDSFSLALHGAQSIFQTAEEPRFAAAAGNTGRCSRVRAGKGVAGNVERSRSSPGNRGGPQYHGGREVAATRGVGNTAQELSARQSCTALCALGGGIEFALGSRCRKGSGKSARTESLDRPPQRRDNALKAISSALETARKRLAIAHVKAEVSSCKDGAEIKLSVRRGRNQVKV